MLGGKGSRTKIGSPVEGKGEVGKYGMGQDGGERRRGVKEGKGDEERGRKRGSARWKEGKGGRERGK